MIVYAPEVAVLVWVKVGDLGSARATWWVVEPISSSVKVEPSLT